MKLVLKRDVLISECPWLKYDLTEGAVFARFTKPTYGCIGPSGTAVSVDGKYPFFELPTEALEETA